MVKIAPGVDLKLPAETHDPYQWGGEGDHGETNPVRNYIAACQDAQEAAVLVSDEDLDIGMPTHQDWAKQIAAAQPLVGTFEDIGDDGLPAAVPREFVDLQSQLYLERPDVEVQLATDRHARMRVETELFTIFDNEREFEIDQFEPPAGSGGASRYVIDHGPVPVQDTEGKTVWAPQALSGCDSWEDAHGDALLHARGLPGEWQGGRLTGVPEHAVVSIAPETGESQINRTDWVIPDDFWNTGQGTGKKVSVELGSDLMMWVEPALPGTGQQQNEVARCVAKEFGVDHQRYVGEVVFTGDHDGQGNSRALNPEQAAAVKEIADYYSLSADERNPEWLMARGLELADTFDHRLKRGEGSTSTDIERTRAEHHRLAMDHLNAQSGTAAAAPGVG